MCRRLEKKCVWCTRYVYTRLCLDLLFFVLLHYCVYLSSTTPPNRIFILRPRNSREPYICRRSHHHRFSSSTSYYYYYLAPTRIANRYALKVSDVHFSPLRDLPPLELWFVLPISLFPTSDSSLILQGAPHSGPVGLLSTLRILLFGKQGQLSPSRQSFVRAASVVFGNNGTRKRSLRVVQWTGRCFMAKSNM